MSLEYYGNLVARSNPLTPIEQNGLRSRFTAHPDLLRDAIRITLALYWQNRGSMARLGDDDLDEAIGIVIASLPALIVKWDWQKAALSTYLYLVVPHKMRRVFNRIQRETNKYVTGVFNVDPEEYADVENGYSAFAGDTAQTEDVSDLPITDVIYSDEPLGMMQPDRAASLDDTVNLLQQLADGTISVKAYADKAGCGLQMAYRRKQALLELNLSQEGGSGG